MKKLFSIIITVCIALNVLAFGAFAADDAKFTATAYFSYEDGKAYLMIEGTTPAPYNQEVAAMVYDPCFTEEDGLENLKDEYGNLVSDISAARPLSDVTKILRLEDTKSSDGEFSMKIPVDGIANGQYMIINVGGNGSMSGAVSTLAYYETEEHLNSVTLPAFENATADTIGDLLAEKQYLLGLDLGEEYKANKDKIHSLFVSVRTDDIEAVAGRKINSTDDVITIYKYALALAALPEEPTAADVESFVSKNKSILSYDFSDDNKDWVLAEDSYAELAAGILAETPAGSMSDMAKTITQSVGIIMLNSKDSTTIAPVVEKYAAILGVDPDDYAIYCDTYTASEVNKAFVAKDFSLPSEVVAALKARVASLAGGGSSGGGSGSGSGGSGGSGGGSGSPSSSYFDKIVKTAPELVDFDESFSDIDESHWAYESVSSLTGKNVLNGFEDGTFRPDAEVTREQFVKMIVTAFDLYYDNGIASFDDVPESRWSHQYVLTAASANIVNGVSKSEFAPENAVTRQDAAVMLARLCKKVGITLSGEVTSTDADEISDYAKESVAQLKAAQIISGFEDGSFKPMQSLTRAQAAKLIYGLLGRI